MTLKLIHMFLVGEFLKSTRHLYVPWSLSRVLSSSNVAGGSGENFVLLAQSWVPNDVFLFNGL